MVLNRYGPDSAVIRGIHEGESLTGLLEIQVLMNRTARESCSEAQVDGLLWIAPAYTEVPLADRALTRTQPGPEHIIGNEWKDGSRVQMSKKVCEPSPPVPRIEIRQ